MIDQVIAYMFIAFLAQHILNIAGSMGGNLGTWVCLVAFTAAIDIISGRIRT